MPRYEYKVVPAPTKGLKGKGVKGAEARFSHAIQELMNGLAGYGWEYQRAETLPSLERSGLASTTTEWRNVLVFRRLRENDADAFTPELLPPPEAAIDTPPEPSEKPVEPPAEPRREPVVTAPEPAPKSPDEPTVEATETAEENWPKPQDPPADNSGIGSTLKKFAAARNKAETDS